MDLDRDTLSSNTPAARANLVNAPEWARGMSLASYPRAIPEGIQTWRRDRGIVLFGSVGAGKTGLAVSLLRDLAEDGHGSQFYWNLVTATPGMVVHLKDPSPCWYESWPRLLSLYRRQRWDEEGWFDLLEKRISALLLDDVGVDAGTPFRESFLLRHVEWAAEANKILILTLNDRPADWVRVLGDRVADRLLEASRFALAEVKGASLRQ